MTQEQITKYEYCKKHLADIDLYIEKLPFKIQKYGASSQSPKIEHELETLHRIMYRKIIDALNVAKIEIQSKIDNI